MAFILKLIGKKKVNNKGLLSWLATPYATRLPMAQSLAMTLFTFVWASYSHLCGLS